MHIARIYIRSLLLTIGFIAGCSSSESEVPSANPYDNGFRLVTIRTDNLLFDTLDGTTTYDYSDNFRNITRTLVRGPAGDTETFVNLLSLDSAGFLRERIARPENDFSASYEYNNDGQLITYISPSKRQEFYYQNDKIAEISDGSNTLSFKYDNDGRLASTTGTVLVETTSYSYNDSNQLVSATSKNMFGEIGFTYELEYDANNNISQLTTIRRFGDVYQVDQFEYEQTDAPVYNQPLFRWAAVPFNNVVFNIGLD